MKLTNHNKNNAYTIAPDSSVMRGTITMTRKESEAVSCMLINAYYKASKLVDTYTRDSLSHIEARMRKGNASILSLGVTATKLIVEKYNLPNYKDINYGIKIN